VEAHDWKAAWIWSSKAPASDINDKVHFRKVFELPPGLEEYSLSILVSADSRYRLYVNGHAAGIGPCKGDAYETYYEEYELSSLLRPGRNVIAAAVLHYASVPSTTSGPVSIHRSPRGGFFLQGSVTAGGQELLRLDTDETWSCATDPSYRLVCRSWRTSVWMGGVEEVDGRRLPAGWEKAEYEDAYWEKATVVAKLGSEHGVLPPWRLAPRPIPMLYEKAAKVRRMVRSSLSDTEEARLEAMLRGEGSFSIPAGNKLSAEVDAGWLTTGYLHVGVEKGKNARISLLPSESYEAQLGEWEFEKRHREDSRNGKLVGDPDVYIAGGWGTSDAPEVYEPFWFRTFRFVRLEIETGRSGPGPP